MFKLSFKIEEMDCAEEVKILKKALLPLVESEEDLLFDILNAKITVRLHSKSINAETIQSAVAKTGMKAIIWQETIESNQHQDQKKETFWHNHGKSIIVISTGLLLIAGVVSHVLLHGMVDALSSGSGIDADIFPITSKLFYLSSILTGALLFAPKAFFAIRNHRADINLLMTVAVIGAIIIGEWFEASAVTFLFSLAQLLEAWSINRARTAIKSLLEVAPTVALCKDAGDGTIVEKPVEDVPVGTVVVVRPGEKVPLDGRLTLGATSINQAPITGESSPVSKVTGDNVFAGSINIASVFEFSSTKPAYDTTLHRIIHMVEEAQSRRAPTEQWVERFTAYYTPVMMSMALLLALIPPLITGGNWGDWFYNALVLLVIACPCAMVISTPVSVVCGLASAAGEGVLIKGGAFLEIPAKLRAMALDKTGTLTYGKPKVEKIVPFSGHTEDELLTKAASLEASSTHPLASAVLDFAKLHKLEFSPADNYTIIAGKGASAEIHNKKYWIGSHRLIEDLGMETKDFHKTATILEDAGHSIVAICNEDHICGIISVADSIRKETPGVITELKQLGIEKIIMLTGDNKGTAEAVASASMVDEYYAELLPEDKTKFVSMLDKRYGTVAMVGDGINDAPAMATATLSIAMGAIGTDVAIETADIALMSDNLSKIPWLIRHSKRTFNTVRQNIFFALGLKLLFAILAIGGVATLWMAIVADMGASLIVILNGIRLLKIEK